ncbi:RluA family pseudouridine synthase [Kroppenstedtia eburnea]|uniref:Pseudouridine synthase n=1 Tax=Kroppenstedtia eburnea TaxID=714067 RepID=A0A1N7J3Z7_9BACL|nr:RluA family pseudouridine synthase [Kroppenstedtia eburnea]QKI82484.1 RluA family pseudouridine synthase [Kroppenstedtia eburnea]SIS44073.1 ribosomal large subunit pseudouridine synthase D [Kroppenstedtia eburnea]
MTAEEEIRSWRADESDAGERVDKFLAGKEADWSRMAVQSWIREHRVRVDGRIVKSNHRLQGGEQVEVAVPPPEEAEVKPEALPLEVVFEDGDVIMVNKPRGMVVHPAPGSPSGTLVNALLAHCDDLSGIGGVLRPGIVHRIDKDTSGLIMVAKNDFAHRSLAAQLKNHTVDREYTALVQGNIPHDRGTVDAPIGRDPHHRKRMAVEHRHGKPAVTHFEVIERFSRATLIRCRLETGRTHQIRVHMKSIGHPLVGDPVYSTRYRDFPIDGQALHARLLGFDHPRTGERICRELEMPEDMRSLVEGFRRETL